MLAAVAFKRLFLRHFFSQITTPGDLSFRRLGGTQLGCHGDEISGARARPCSTIQRCPGARPNRRLLGWTLDVTN